MLLRSPGLRRMPVWGMAVAMAFLCAAPSAPAQETPRELRTKASSAMAAGAFEDAIPPLEQLLEWYKDSKDDVIMADMESLMYSLGMCHLFLGHFPECRTVLEAYLKKYPYVPRTPMAQLFISDSYRYEAKYPEALKNYETCLTRYAYLPDVRTDILACMARCHLATEDWAKAVPLLLQVVRSAYDPSLRNWAASMLTVSYLKDQKFESVYDLVPLLLQPDSFASRSVALNVTALQAADDLFADEKYRDALWIYRLVYPRDTLSMNASRQLERLQMSMHRLKRMSMVNPRDLLRAQETVSELEAEVEALEKIPNYDPELFFRMARSYFEIRRYRESGALFYGLYQEGLVQEKEECLYLSFLSASNIRPPDTAIARGGEYMRAYPKGAHYDGVSLAVGQIHANRQDWPKVMDTLGTAIAVSPKHESIVECLFLMGYASFMEEKFEDTVRLLGRMNTEFPGNERDADGSYWMGMAEMFRQNYEAGRAHFERVVNEFASSTYYEDARFRVATCAYGMSEFAESEQMLLDFLRDFPQSRLLGEANLMLGDVLGARGALPEAVARYQQAMNYEMDMSLYNHAAFRCGEMLKEIGDHNEVITHFVRYIERNKEGSNIPLAVYNIGEAYWDLKRPADTFRYFRQAIERYGRARGELGIDLILEQYVGRARNTTPELAKQAWADLRTMRGDAVRKNEFTLLLRLNRTLMYAPDASEPEKKSMRDFMLRPERLPQASAGVLEYMLDEARKAGLAELAAQVADTLIKDFPETDYALSARAWKADEAAQRKDYDEAIKHYNIIREVFATHDEAARALLALGHIYIEQQKYADADAAFKDLTGVKEWKALWPAALFGRGEVARGLRQYDKASAYFERIYVMYGGSRPWAGKAYVARAECLQRLRENKKALETLNEFLAREDWSETPEAAEARALKDKLAGSGGAS